MADTTRVTREFYLEGRWVPSGEVTTRYRLAPGYYEYANFSGIRGGATRAKFTVDPGNLIVEIDESNNVAYVDFPSGWMRDRDSG